MTSKFDCFGPGFFAGFFKVGLPQKTHWVFWVRTLVSEPCFQNVWFNKTTHPNEQRNWHRLSTKWALGNDQSSVRLWPRAAIQGFIVCGRAVCQKRLCIN